MIITHFKEKDMEVNETNRTNATSNINNQEYNEAQVKLATASLPLTFKSATIKQLGDFITSAMFVHDVCRDNMLDDSPLDVLLWLRRRLQKETKDVERDELYRAHCLREVDIVERKIAITCVNNSHGSLTLLE